MIAPDFQAYIAYPTEVELLLRGAGLDVLGVFAVRTAPWGISSSRYRVGVNEEPSDRTKVSPLIDSWGSYATDKSLRIIRASIAFWWNW